MSSGFLDQCMAWNAQERARLERQVSDAWARYQRAQKALEDFDKPIGAADAFLEKFREAMQRR